MPGSQQVHGLPRQRPVSCRFCRSRKLRCSRKAPCSNCVSRGIRCELESPAVPSSESLGASEPELVERIRRLELLLGNQKSQRSESLELHSSDPHVQQPRMLNLSSHTENIDNDAAWLESIYSGQDLSDKILSNKIVFRMCPIRKIMEAQQYIICSHNSFLPSTNLEPSRCIWLPEYHEAKILLEKFIQNIDHIHHVVHTPSLLGMLDEVYNCLNQQSQVKPGKMILLLSIFATCTHSWAQHDLGRGLFSSAAEANRQSPLWTKAVEDVLDISYRTTSVSIEGIQGIIICLFVQGSLEGFYRRCRLLYNMGLLLARELGLHVLDHPSNAHLANSAQAEIGRRVWWYLVASDWAMAARFDGVAKGVYQCHLRQMVTKKPLNINDEDVVDGMSRIEQPLSQPTTMSYSLHRIRLAEISRSIVDRTPIIMAQGGGPSHDTVMDIDTELQLLVNDIPPFFSMSITELTESYQLDPDRGAKFVHQGYMFRSLLYAQRCKLHFPYYSRGFVDSAYASSRELCLQSARLVIQNESQLENSGLCLTVRYKLLGFLMGVFMASIVLLMDACHNKSSPPHDKNQRAEIADAFRIMGEARHESEMAAKFLDSLMHVLRKHKVWPSKHAGQRHSEQSSAASCEAAVYCTAITTTTTQLYSEPALASMPMTPPSMLGGSESSGTSVVGGGFLNGDDMSCYFNELAQSFEQGANVGSFDWNNIFSGIESSFI